MQTHCRDSTRGEGSIMRVGMPAREGYDAGLGLILFGLATCGSEPRDRRLGRATVIAFSPRARVERTR